jgi:hypothetical protein
MANKKESLIAACLLLWAILPINPYGYYQFLKIIICGMSIYFASNSKDKNQEKWFYIMIFFAILYNPVFPIHLKRSWWQIINLFTGITMLVYYFKQKNDNPI